MTQPALAPAIGPRSRAGRVVRLPVARMGVVLAVIATVIAFSVLRPDTFATIDNWRNILQQAAIPTVLALGLTLALIMGDFDLSIGATVGVAMGVSVKLMSTGSMGWVAAIVVTLGVGVAIGVVNGGLVSYLGLNSFIATLATGSIISGLESKITDQKTIYNGIPNGFADLGHKNFLLGLQWPVWIAAGVALLLYVIMHQSEPGRYMYAIGGNREASMLAGLNVRRLRLLGFVAAGVCAAAAGVLLAAKSVSYYPSAGTSTLLPAYAAAFLGAAASANVRFKVLGTVLGVLFLGIIQSGLTLMNVESWVVNVVQGTVLVLAIGLSRLEQLRS